MQKTDVINELAASLGKAQSEIGVAEFNSVNPFLNNKYADLGSVIQAARPALAKNNLSFSQLVSGDGANISVETVLMHSSGQWIASTVSLPVGDEKGKSQAQVAGSIVTYLRRYALAAALGIYADEDTDGNTTAGNTTAGNTTAGNGNKQPAQAASRQQPAQTKAPTAPPAKPAPAQTKAPKPSNVAQDKIEIDPYSPWAGVVVAGNVRTQKGTYLHTLTKDQLNIIVSKSPDGEIKKAASVLLDKPDDKDWTLWYALVEKADFSGVIATDPPNDTTAFELYKQYERLEKDIEAAKAIGQAN